MSEVHVPTESGEPPDTFLGHLFGDWSHGIDHLRCGHCGLPQHLLKEQGKTDCPVAVAGELGPGGLFEAAQEDFGAIWAVRPELGFFDIYGETDSPDVQQFESQEQLLEWLDGGGSHITNRERRWYGRTGAAETRESIRALPLRAYRFSRSPPASPDEAWHPHR